MSEEKKHTPLPWYVGKTADSTYDITDDDGGNTLAVMVGGANEKENAFLIVEACNNYGNLKAENETLREVLRMADVHEKTLQEKLKTLSARESKLVEALKEIGNACGTVNFSSHNQMREAIEAALSISDAALAPYAQEKGEEGE
jgi:hypothetical protein